MFVYVDCFFLPVFLLNFFLFQAEVLSFQTGEPYFAPESELPVVYCPK